MKRILSLLITILLIFNLSACENGKIETKKNGRIYECDYKTLNLNTKITTTYNDSEISISGNIFKLLTDPLTVKDSEGNILGYAGDAYGVIEQDDHGIYVGDNFEVNMCGNFELLGNSYKLKDSEGNIVAKANFNELNTSGSITDIKGNLVATYSSPIIANDYTVTIYDNDICSDISILMGVSPHTRDFSHELGDTI